jgi:hypothetical protein
MFQHFDSFAFFSVHLAQLGQTDDFVRKEDLKDLSTSK